MTYRGTVRSGAIVLYDPVDLPEGAAVEVTMAEPISPPDDDGIGAKLAALGRWVETLPTDLPTDLAANHDHYLHGRPKRP